jgi:hypothetical protein
MLSKCLRKSVSRFSKSFYQTAVLDYPISRTDENSLKNKILMDESNQNYLNVLKKVLMF